MIGKLAGYGLTAAILAGMYPAGSYAAHKTLGMPYTADPEILQQDGFAYSTIKGVFGGDNLLLNAAAEFGGGWASKKLKRKSDVISRYSKMKTASQIPKWTGPAHAKDLAFINRSHLSQRRYLRTTGNKSALKQAVGYRAKASYLNKMSTSIRKVSRLAAWAPMAVMAFDMVGSLSNLPSPQQNYNPRKAAALSGTFLDTGLAYTQRQRALQAMHNSQYSGRSALGNEASLMHS